MPRRLLHVPSPYDPLSLMPDNDSKSGDYDFSGRPMHTMTLLAPTRSDAT